MSKKKNGKHISGDPRKRNSKVGSRVNSLNISMEKETEYKNYFDTMFNNHHPRTIEELISFSEKIREFQFQVGTENEKTSSEKDWCEFKKSLSLLSTTRQHISDFILPFDGKNSRVFLLSMYGNQITGIRVIKDKTPREVLSLVCSGSRMVG